MNGISSTSTDIANKYLYNGKEMQEHFWLDYGFRQYDPALARWHVTDALAEWHMSHSPYAYVRNNPVNYYDVMGLYDDYEKGNPVEPGDSGGSFSAGAGEPNPNYNTGNEITYFFVNSYYSADWRETTGFGGNSGGGMFTGGGGGGGYNYTPDDPPWHIHYVRPGETIMSISRLYAVPPEDIFEANPNIQWDYDSKGNYVPLIYPYDPDKLKPWKWQGEIPPTWFVNKIIIPQPKVTGPNPMKDISAPGIYQFLIPYLGLITKHPDHYGNIEPGQGQENHAYYSSRFGAYFEWEYTNSEQTMMEVRFYDSYRKEGAMWRGTHRQSITSYGHINKDGSWTFGPGI